MVKRSTVYLSVNGMKAESATFRRTAKRGLVLDYTIEENLILEVYNRPPYSKNGLLQPAAIRKHAEHIIQSFDVRSGTGGRSIVRSMSGGNQQKRSSAAR